MTTAQPVTTMEKLDALVAHVRTMQPAEATPQHRALIEGLQILAGFGIDPLAMLLPDSDADADAMVDDLIALLFQVRGDDLPPFDLERHMTDATATDD